MLALAVLPMDYSAFWKAEKDDGFSLFRIDDSVKFFQSGNFCWSHSKSGVWQATPDHLLATRLETTLEPRM